MKGAVLAASMSLTECNARKYTRKYAGRDARRDANVWGECVKAAAIKPLEENGEWRMENGSQTGSARHSDLFSYAFQSRDAFQSSA